MRNQFWPFANYAHQFWWVDEDENTISQTDFVKVVEGTWKEPQVVLEQLEKQWQKVQWVDKAKRITAERNIKATSKAKEEMEAKQNEKIWFWASVKNSAEKTISNKFPVAKLISDTLGITDTNEVDEFQRWVAMSIPWTVTWIVSLINDWKWEELDKHLDWMIEATWVDVDSWAYKWWELAWSIWQFFVAPQATFAKIWAILKAGKTPKIAKAIERYNSSKWIKKLLWKTAEFWTKWAVETQWFNIATEWEFATKEETAIWAWVWWALWAVWSFVKWIKNVFTNAWDDIISQSAKIPLESLEKYDAMSKASLVDSVKNLSPIESVKTKVLTALDTVVEPLRKWTGKELWEIRDKLQPIEFNTKGLVKRVVDEMRDFGIRITNVNWVMKGKWVMKAKGKSIAWSDKVLVTKVVELLNEVSKTNKYRNNAWWAEFIIKEIQNLTKTKGKSSFSNKLWKLIHKEWGLLDDFNKWLPEETAKALAESKGIYGKYKTMLDSVSSKPNKARALLKKWLKWDEEAINFFDELAELTWEPNLLADAHIARFVQVINKDRAWVLKSLWDWFYPSLPWIYEAWIRMGANNVFDPILELAKAHPEHVTPELKKILEWLKASAPVSATSLWASKLEDSE